jgi:hypothetical protein
MPSNNWVQMDAAVRARDWEAATDWLNSLAMSEMLPALQQMAGRSEFLARATQILTTRGWSASIQRIRWAGEAVETKTLPTWTPTGLPPDQIEDAKRFLPSPAELYDTGPAVADDIKAEVSAASRTGKIRGDNGQIAAVLKDGVFLGRSGLKFFLANAMFPVLASLARGGVVEILSLMADRGAPHGEAVGDDVRICWGMDIKGYAGFQINLVNGAADTTVPQFQIDSTISGVAAVISNLPAGRFRMGMTRPSSAPGGPAMPAKDVFLPYDPPKFPMYMHLDRSLIVNPAARTAINAAVAGNPKAKMEAQFVDGVDHVHIEVWDGHPKKRA